MDTWKDLPRTKNEDKLVGLVVLESAPTSLFHFPINSILPCNLEPPEFPGVSMGKTHPPSHFLSSSLALS